jgi:hypothetical protein
MTRHFVRKAQTLIFVTLFVSIVTVLATLASLAQARDANQPTMKSSAASLPPGAPTSQGTPARLSKKRNAASGADSGSVSFEPPVTYGTGGYTGTSVVIADLNGDGRPDLVVVNECISVGDCSSGTVGILLGKGDGTFQEAVTYNSGYFSNRVAVADVNGDGKKDLVVANSCVAANNCSSGTIDVLLGNGDGTFAPALSYNSGTGQALAVAIGDVNGDGRPDVVVANWSSGMAVLLGNGDGTFRAPVAYETGGDNDAVAIADVNGDGKLDVLIGDQITVNVLLGNGDGTFQPEVAYPVWIEGDYPVGVGSVSVADVNGDGKPDIVAGFEGSGNNGDGSAAVLLGNGDGTFQPVVNYDSGATDGVSVGVADLNGDGKLDIVITNYGAPPYPPAGTIGVLVGNGDGTFQPAIVLPADGGFTVSVAVADLNGDGKPDVVVVNQANSNLAVFLNNTGVSQAPTTTALLSSLNPSNDGETVSFTATVSSRSGTPTGTVVFYDGASSLGSVALASGSASLSTASLTPGSHAMTASYQGSSGFAPSTSSVLNQVVNASNTSTSLASSNNPCIKPCPVTFTATVTSGLGTPTGTVLFIDGSNYLGSATLAAGVATFSYSGFHHGTHPITAAYQGSGAFTPSTSPVLDQVVYERAFYTRTSVSTSRSPSFVGQPVTFTATVESIGGGGVPNGEPIAFYEHYSVLIGTGTLSGGEASVTTSSLTVGKHTIRAIYNGDGIYRKSRGSTTQAVEKYATTTALVGSPNPAVYGQAVTYTATVTSTGPGIPTGKVKLTGVGEVPLINGVATITKSLVSAGTHPITAEYIGDDDFGKSTSPVWEEVVNQASTTTVLTSSANPSSSGQSVTFTATVTSSTGLDPFGKVTFTAGGVTLSVVALKDTVAQVSTAALPVGSTTITATYGGAEGFTGSSASLTQVVQP